jgi:acetyl esterase/lipase
VAVGDLIGAVLSAICTACALWPPRARGALGTAAYLVGMVYNELPVLAMVLVLGTSLPSLNGSALATPLGLVATALRVATLAGLAVMLQRALRGRGVTERAMVEALGPDWRSEIDPHLAAGLRTRVPVLRTLLVPFLRRRLDVERIPNLAYADGGRRQRLDLYRSRARPLGGPVLVHLHGGRFVSGAKNRESLPLLYRLASQGWLCISANYRLQPQAGFPDYVVDVKRVLAWVCEHGPSYGADPTTVFVAGNSAGGYLAAFAALTQNDPAYQPGFADADTSVTAAIGLYGYYGRTESTVPESSPEAHVHPDAPPFLLIHGDRDSVVPVEWGRRFADALRTVSRQPVVWTEIPDAQHSFDYFTSPRAWRAVDQIEAFAAWVRSRRPQVRRRLSGL